MQEFNYILNLLFIMFFYIFEKLILKKAYEKIFFIQFRICSNIDFCGPTTDDAIKHNDKIADQKKCLNLKALCKLYY